MTILKKLKLFIAWVFISPWVGAFLINNLDLMHNYFMPVIINMFVWLGLCFVGAEYFAGRKDEIQKEFEGKND